MLDRRTLLGLGVGGLASIAGVAGTKFRGETAAAVSPAGLRVHAAKKGLSFGSMVMSDQLAQDAALDRVIISECDTIVPGIQLKWGFTGARESTPNYLPAKSISRFAQSHGLRMRGHTAFWYRNLPNWVVPELSGPGATAIVLDRVSSIVGSFRGEIFEWDVVNEAVEPKDGQPNSLRLAPFGRPMDIGWIAECFAAAHHADPAARLFYNDYGIENDAQPDEDRRRAILSLLSNLKSQGVPVHGLGLQTHIGVGQRVAPQIYRSFLKEVAGLGLEIRLTELDVNDRKAPADVATRDQMVADRVSEVLDVALDEPAVKGVICWGLRDSDSYIRQSKSGARLDGMPQRPLPFDDALVRKPFWSALARAFDNAPAR